MKRIFGLLVVFFFLVTLTSVAFGENLRFAVVYPIVHLFFNETTRGAQDAAKEFGVEVEVLGPDTADISQQVAIVEGLIARGIDGIGLGVLDPTALTPYINSALEKGIPVVTFDTDAPESERLCFIGTNNVEAGKHAVRVAVDLLQKKYGAPKGKICISMGVPTQLNLNQRLEGFKKIIAKLSGYPDCRYPDRIRGS